MDPNRLSEFVHRRFLALCDEGKAAVMAAYMKSDMPFYGIQRRDREPVYREMKRRYCPTSSAEYAGGIRALWDLRRREARYAAIEYATQHGRFIDGRAMEMYEYLIRDGAWWDLVDPVAINLVGCVLRSEREEHRAQMEAWVTDEHLWIRRSAILSQLKHKESTDTDQLYRFCLGRAGDTDFFIRKAIGWALREYSKTNPPSVQQFLSDNRRVLAPLSYREGAKYLIRSGMMSA